MARSPNTPIFDEDVPPAIRESMFGLALASGGANVIMQLSQLPIGHGVAKSTVESGRVDRHPIKRLRTTTAFLVIALLGTGAEREAMRRNINRAHATVRSDDDDPVAYNAFDPELQLWIAACLYKGVEDGYRWLHGNEHPDVLDEVIYPWCRRFGTTLQVPEDAWPVDRAAFDDYWKNRVDKIEMDALTRRYLQGIAQLRFVVPKLGPLTEPMRRAIRPFGEFMNLGMLPEPFLAELGIPWSPKQQRSFDAVGATMSKVVRALPKPLFEFPLNLYLWDTRRRIASGRPVV